MHMKVLFILWSGLVLASCLTQKKPVNSKEVTLDETQNTAIHCPVTPHADSIIPIVYGYPSEELFNKADSGLVMLGGCEIPEIRHHYWCKRHKVEF